MYKLNQAVEVKPSWKSEIFETYYNAEDLIGKKGEVIELYSDGRARVRFSKIKRWTNNNGEVEMEDFVWPFWIKDIECVSDIIPKERKHIRRTGKALESKRSTAKRLKGQGITIKEISEQLEAPYNTVVKWIYQNR